MRGGAISRWGWEGGELRRQDWVPVGEGPAHLLVDEAQVGCDWSAGAALASDWSRAWPTPPTTRRAAGPPSASAPGMGAGSGCSTTGYLDTDATFKNCMCFCHDDLCILLCVFLISCMQRCSRGEVGGGVPRQHEPPSLHRQPRPARVGGGPRLRLHLPLPPHPRTRPRQARRHQGRRKISLATEKYFLAR